MRRLNRYEIIKIRWLCVVENFVSDRDNITFSLFRNFTPVMRQV